MNIFNTDNPNNNIPDKKKERFFQRKFINLSLTLFLGIALSISFFFLLYNSHSVNLGIGKFINAVKPFIYGAVIAFLLVPMCNFFDKAILFLLKKASVKTTEKTTKIIPVISIIISYLLAFVIIYILMSLVIPQFVASLTTLVNNFDMYYDNITKLVNEYFNDNGVLHNYAESITTTLSETFENWIQTELLPNSKTLLANVSSGVIGAFSMLKNIFVGLIVSVYCLGSRKSFAAQAKILTHAIFKKKAADKIIKEVQYTNQMFMGFILGKIVDSTIIGILCFIGVSILKMPFPLLISVIVGITNVIPFFGPFIGAIPSAFIILMVDPIKCIWFIIFILVLQQLDGNVIGPKILGDKINLSSFWTLFAIMVFSGLFGFSGLIFGVPLFAVIYHLIQELIMLGLKRTKYVPTEEEAEVSLLNAYFKDKNIDKNTIFESDTADTVATDNSTATDDTAGTDNI